MGALVDYWYYTGDDTYNDVTQQGLLFQVGPENDYMPPNQSLTEGNDDQGFWGMAVMTAAEYNFQDPPPDQPQWLALAQAVFNTQAARWDTTECGGGLRWQIFTWNNGYDYKNSISQACFFNLAARLARYTGNQSYADWADKTWDWMVDTGLIDVSTYDVVDGMHVKNCSQFTPYQWSYNVGGFLIGAAAMYNFTEGSERETWRDRVDGLLNGTNVFFKNGVMTEVACEPVNLCNIDQQSFKAYLSRWMAATTKWAPWTYDRVKPLMATSAVAAASQCQGGSNGRMCGLKWTDNGKYDGSTGVGQQMSAMEIVLANMVTDSAPPVTNSTGGTSQGDPSAGGSDVGRTDPLSSFPPITTGDRAGAWILTLVVIAALVAGCIFVLLDETSPKTVRQRWAGLPPMMTTTAAGLLRKRPGRRPPPPSSPLGLAGAGFEDTKEIERSDSDDRSSGSQVGWAMATPEPEPRAGAPVEELSSYYQHRSARAAGPGPIERPAALRLPPMVARDHRASYPGTRARKPLRKRPVSDVRVGVTGVNGRV